MRTVVLTISTTLARGEGQDTSGPHLAELLREAGCEVLPVEVLPDDRAAIAARLRALVADDVRFVVTTGGTGLTPDDVTPEATRDVIERDAPAFQQAMLIEGLRHQPLALLTRGVSGIAGRTLIINLPGNPKAIDQLVPVFAPALRHAADSLTRDGGRAAGEH
ncbi:MAG TPA: MogA/MoaB family molybdenum cofactor biosynthesis protein [Solirubrobacteraceae bacterium]